MKWEQLLKIVKDQPVIETHMLLDRAADTAKLSVQLSRWTKTGRLIKIKKGMYLLSGTYRHKPVQFDYLSTLVYRPSYISLEYALADYGLIPEAVPNVTLVTTRRPIRMKVEGRVLIYRHVKRSLFWGYEARGERNFEVFYAEPEKALLDYFWLTHGVISDVFLDEMRLQNVEVLDTKKLLAYSERFGSRKITEAASVVCEYVDRQKRVKEL